MVNGGVEKDAGDWEVGGYKTFSLADISSFVIEDLESPRNI